MIAPFGDAYEKIGTIQRRLAWPLHKDDTLFQSGRPTGLNIYFSIFFGSATCSAITVLLTLGCFSHRLPVHSVNVIWSSNRRRYVFSSPAPRERHVDRF